MEGFEHTQNYCRGHNGLSMMLNPHTSVCLVIRNLKQDWPRWPYAPAMTPSHPHSISSKIPQCCWHLEYYTDCVSLLLSSQPTTAPHSYIAMTNPNFSHTNEHVVHGSPLFIFCAEHGQVCWMRKVDVVKFLYRKLFHLNPLMLSEVCAPLQQV